MQTCLSGHVLKAVVLTLQEKVELNARATPLPAYASAGLWLVEGANNRAGLMTTRIQLYCSLSWYLSRISYHRQSVQPRTHHPQTSHQLPLLPFLEHLQLFIRNLFASQHLHSPHSLSARDPRSIVVDTTYRIRCSLSLICLP